MVENMMTVANGLSTTALGDFFNGKIFIPCESGPNALVLELSLRGVKSLRFITPVALVETLPLMQR